MLSVLGGHFSVEVYDVDIGLVLEGHDFLVHKPHKLSPV